MAASESLSALWDDLVPERDRAGPLSPADGFMVEMALRYFLPARRVPDEIGEEVSVADPARRREEEPGGGGVPRRSKIFLKYAAQLGVTLITRARPPSRRWQTLSQPVPASGATDVVTEYRAPNRGAEAVAIRPGGMRLPDDQRNAVTTPSCLEPY